jgi:Tol biopolymer transport system component
MLRGALLVMVLIAFVGFGVRQTGAAPGVRNGPIVYSHLGAGADRSQIYTTSVSGKQRRRLTDSRRYSSLAPSYSQNGQRIVFVRASKQSDLWTMNADGSRQRRLTPSPGIDEIDPTWSPNGRFIAFSVESPVAMQGIWVIRRDGRGRQQLTSGNDLDPAWSPSGNQIAFERSTASPAAGPVDQLYVVSPFGGAPRDLSNDPSVSDLQPTWSPDGSRILFSSGPADGFQLDLWTMKADGSGRHPVTDTPRLDEHDPAWSPDGRKIAYVGEASGNGAASYQLYVSKASGTKRRIVTHARGDAAIINEDPSWQPLWGLTAPATTSAPPR